MRIVMRTVRK